MRAYRSENDPCIDQEDEQLTIAWITFVRVHATGTVNVGMHNKTMCRIATTPTHDAHAPRLLSQDSLGFSFSGRLCSNHRQKSDAIEVNVIAHMATEETEINEHYLHISGRCVQLLSRIWIMQHCRGKLNVAYGCTRKVRETLYCTLIRQRLSKQLDLHTIEQNVYTTTASWYQLFPEFKAYQKQRETHPSQCILSSDDQRRFRH